MFAGQTVTFLTRVSKRSRRKEEFVFTAYHLSWDTVYIVHSQNTGKAINVRLILACT
jgi:hypothetical protein